MLAKPDPATFQILPWRSESPGTRPDVLRHRDAGRHRRPTPTRGRCSSAPWPRPPTSGFTFYTHPEIEFFLFRDQPGDGRAARRRSTRAATSTTSRTASATTSAATRSRCSRTMGISVEFSHHEGAPGQQEIDLRYADALSTADNIMTFRHVMKQVALSQGVYASFMPKPFTDHPGSGHAHPPVAVRGRPQRLLRGRRAVPAVQGGAVVHRRAAAARRARSRRSPTSGSTPTSGCSAAARPRRTSAGGTTTGPPWCGCRCTSRPRASRPGSRCASPDSAPTRTSPSR